MNKITILGHIDQRPDIYATEGGGCITYLRVRVGSADNSRDDDVIRVRVDGAKAEMGYDTKTNDMIYIEGAVKRFALDERGNEAPWTGVAAKNLFVVD